jgi:Cu+-exporting ATPase
LNRTAQVDWRDARGAGLWPPPERDGVATPAVLQEAPRGETGAACYHCGEPCLDPHFAKGGRSFCCQGCLVVHDLLAENGLDQFYRLSPHPGIRAAGVAKNEQWAYLDDPAVQRRLLDFTDGRLSRITLHIPAIHCVACVWLLENLFRLREGIGKSQVNFPRREVAVQFEPGRIQLSELVALLAAIGYEPKLTLGEMERPKRDRSREKRWLQIGIAGFAFGNIMLFSFPAYFGLDTVSAPVFRRVFGCLSLLLAAPVVVYSAADYWRSAFLSVRQRVLTLDVPIVLGLAALYGQSAFEILFRRGEGYLDSLAGLVFFLLCGRAFQQKTHERMAFDRDYKSFFPLAVRRKTPAGEEHAALSQLGVGDRLLLRHGELIPADGVLVAGPALIDYSFVTGESEPVAKAAGDHLYAGGQQVGGTIEVETVKPVSQSYLTALWNHEAFQKDREDNLNTLTNRYSRRFMRIVLAVAAGALAFWAWRGDWGRGLKAFASVLIVACPCALALAAPFALGTAQRLLARWRAFVKNVLVLERLARVDAVVFDKTGTLTSARANTIEFFGASRNGHGPVALEAPEEQQVFSLARHSTHPHAVRIGESLGGRHIPETVRGFVETPGCGVQGDVQGRTLMLGSRAWLEARGVVLPNLNLPAGSIVALAIDGVFRGAFVAGNALRPESDGLLRHLGQRYEIGLLSGDNEKDRERFRGLFGDGAELRFNQSPLEKLDFIRGLQRSGRTVMMVGDGLNDAGALKQSDVGVAVVERVGAFSPASDIILAADLVPRLGRILDFARSSTRIVRVSFGISAAYNAVGISIASAGILSPLICAVLMPLSSVSVVLFACGMTTLAARRAGLSFTGKEPTGETGAVA